MEYPQAVGVSAEYPKGKEICPEGNYEQVGSAEFVHPAKMCVRARLVKQSLNPKDFFGCECDENKGHYHSVKRDQPADGEHGKVRQLPVQRALSGYVLPERERPSLGRIQTVSERHAVPPNEPLTMLTCARPVNTPIHAGSA